MKYKRGDIVWLDYPFSNLTESRERPALIISNELVNHTGDYILAQITSKYKDYRSLSIPLEDRDYVEAPLELKSFVRVDKLFTLNELVILEYDTSVTDDYMLRVVRELNTVISTNP